MQIKIAKIVGINSDQEASLAFSEEADDTLFLSVLHLRSDDAFSVGRQILSEAADLSLQAAGPLSSKLTEAYSAMLKKLTETQQFDLILAALSNKVLYIIYKGEVSTILKRGNTASTLSSGEGQLISGFLEEGDKVLLATKSFTDGLNDIDEVFSIPTEELEQEFGEKIKQDSLTKACIVLSAEGETEQELPTIPPLSGSEAQSTKLNLRLTSFFPRISFSKIRNFLPTTKKGRLYLAVILILVILFGVFIQFQSQKNKETEKQLSKLLQTAGDDLNAAKSLTGLNIATAKEKFETAESAIKEAEKLKPKDERVLVLKKQIEDEKIGVFQQFSASGEELILDLQEKIPNSSAEKISLEDGKLVILDKVGKNLILINIGDKNHQILADGEKIGDAQFAIFSGEAIFVYSKDKGIIRVNLDGKQQKAAGVDEGWGLIADIAGYRGNVYLLDKGKNQVWKYTPTTSGYGSRQAYLSSDTKVNFDTANQMVIESSVYILSDSGEISRFLRGKQEQFKLEGVGALKDVRAIFTGEGLESLYVLDSGNSRLLILDKDGKYKKEYKGDIFAQAKSLVVDEVAKKAYLLDGSKIYSVDLK